MSPPRIGLVQVLIALTASTRATAQCPDGAPPPCRPPAHAAAPVANSVAMLYFDNLSPDTADAYLADGLTEEITSRLGELPRLQIKRPSRDAVRRLRDTVPDYLVTLGRILRVRYLLEGSVRRAGSQVRVSARLVGASDGFRLWSADYDRAANDLLALQGEVAQQVATSIAGRLTPRDRAHVTARPTESPEAYEHFLRGNFLLARRDAVSAARAIEEYRAAIRKRPDLRASAGTRRLRLRHVSAMGVGLPGRIPGQLAGGRDARRRGWVDARLDGVRHVDGPGVSAPDREPAHVHWRPRRLRTGHRARPHQYGSAAPVRLGAGTNG